ADPAAGLLKPDDVVVELIGTDRTRRAHQALRCRPRFQQQRLAEMPGACPSMKVAGLGIFGRKNLVSWRQRLAPKREPLVTPDQGGIEYAAWDRSRGHAFH